MSRPIARPVGADAAGGDQRRRRRRPSRGRARSRPRAGRRRRSARRSRATPRRAASGRRRASCVVERAAEDLVAVLVGDADDVVAAGRPAALRGRGGGVALADGLADVARARPAQPQVPPAALVRSRRPCRRARSRSCARRQQFGSSLVSSAMRTAPSGRRGGRSSRPTGRGARSRRCRRRAAS